MQRVRWRSLQRTLLFVGGCRDYKHVKGLIKLRTELAVRPSAVRNEEVEDTALLSWISLNEELVGACREFESPDAFFDICLACGLMPADAPLNSILFESPLLLEESVVHAYVELVDVHGIEANTKTMVRLL